MTTHSILCSWIRDVFGRGRAILKFKVIFENFGADEVHHRTAAQKSADCPHYYAMPNSRQHQISRHAVKVETIAIGVGHANAFLLR